jgi:antitoxin CcdA
MHPLQAPGVSKRPVNLSIDGELLRQARELDINLSRTLEQALESAVKRKRAENWLRQACETYAPDRADDEPLAAFVEARSDY